MADNQDPYGGVDPSLMGGNTGFTGGAPGATAQVKTPGSQIAGWYQQYLGRAPENADVVNAWGGQDAATAQSGIQNSPEAQAYAAAHSAATPATASGLATVAAAPGGGVNYSGGAPPISSAQGANPNLGALRNMLLTRANQSLTVDPNDPTIKAQTDAYSADVTRGGRDFLSQQAESAGPINNMDASYRSVGEKAGQATADYRGKLMQGMVDARRKEISDALSGLGGVISQEDATRLRQEDQDLARQRFGADSAQQAFDDQYKTIFG